MAGEPASFALKRSSDWRDSMEHFLLVARDHEGQLERRLAAREAHVALGDKLVASGNLLYGGAMLDEDQKMMGSMLVCAFNSRDELDEWLKKEPYVTQDVWRDIEILPFKIGPSFQGI